LPNRTTFKIEISDDDLVVELIEQCAVAQMPPAVFLREVVRDILTRARDENLQIIPVPDNETRH